MFGYVTVNKDELKIREFRRYKAYYCGLCDALKKNCGIKGQLILPYDMAFLDMLLSGLYEEPLEERDVRCIAHPLEKQHIISNSITDYCADMGLILAYYKLLDNISDEGSIKARAGAGILKKAAADAMDRWPRQADAAARYMREQDECEKRNESSLDVAAGLTGTVLGEIFVMREDEWSDILRKMAFFLGKFIYLTDAYEDLEEDLKKDRYNPWKAMSGKEGFEEEVKSVLVMLMSGCASEFEKLPIVQDIEILRNIIYSGVWCKYREIRERRAKKREEGR